MRTVTRRRLSHDSARLLDEVLATGEPLEVTTRGRASVLITVKPESVYAQWRAQGLVRPAVAGRRLSELPRASSSRSVAAILAEIDSDH